MARDKITEYDSTASSNTVCGDVNIAENSALPSDMNNFAREIMSHLKEGLGSGTPLYVDQTNNRLGINTSSPSVDLEISGGLSVDGGTIKLDGNYPTGTDNVALGNTALDDGSLSGARNTAIGSASLTANTSGQNNVSVGYNSMLANTTGNDNISVGVGTLDSNTTGSSNTALGRSALQANTTASDNTAVGYQSAYSNTTGSPITAIGRKALYSNTTGVDNTALGRNSLFYNTTGADNTSSGNEAMQANTTGSNNTAYGSDALRANTTASSNTAVGHQAGYSSTTATGNTLIGISAGYGLTTGSYNCFIGGGFSTSGFSMTTGSKNTIIGGFGGNQNSLDIRTSSNNIVLSDGDGNPRLYIASDGKASFYASNDTVNARHTAGANSVNSLYVGWHSATSPTSGTLSYNVTTNGNVTNTNNSYGAISDERLKENIVASLSQWEDIKAVQVKKYSLIADDLDAPNQLGVIAQDLEQSGLNGLVEEQDDKQGGTTKTVKYSILYMKAVKALQEAMERIETLEAKVATLEGE